MVRHYTTTNFSRLMALSSLPRFHTGLLALLAFAVSGIPHIQNREKPLAWFGWKADETLNPGQIQIPLVLITDLPFPSYAKE